MTSKNQRLRNLAGRYNLLLEEQYSTILNEGEEQKAALAREKDSIENQNLYSDFMEKINNPETIDYSFIKKYGIVFLIFFVILWFFIGRKK